MPTSYNSIALVAGRSGSDSSIDSITFYYQSSSYRSISSGSLVTFQANTIEATPSGAYGELDIIVSTSGSIKEKGTSLMKLLHTGSNDEPRVAIGFASNEKPTKSFEIKTKIDSTQATQFVLQSARPSKGAEIGDSAGVITFAIASSSFNDIFTTGAIGEIDTVVIGTGSGDNMSGNVRIKASPEYIEVLENIAEFGFKKRSGDPFNPDTNADSTAILHVSGALIVGFDEHHQGDISPLEVWGRTHPTQATPTPQLVQTGSEFHLFSSSLHVGSGSIFLGATHGNIGNGDIEFVNNRGQGPIKFGQVSGGGGGLNLDFYTSNIHRARLASGGNFRIGASTSTINNKLEIEGNISASGKIITTEAESTGDFLIDAEGDITLDANGADIILSDNGTDFGRFKRDTSNFVIKSETNDKDIIFKGVDNSATITALTLDMSEAGAASFNSTISATGATLTNLSTTTETDFVVVASDGTLSKRTGGGSGSSGSSGSSGTAGSSGSSGSSGTAGSSGSSGSSGTAGTSGVSPTISNDTNNRVTTAVGNGTLNAEENLTFTGTILTLDGTQVFTPGTAQNGISTRADIFWESTTLESSGEFVRVSSVSSTRTQHALYNLGSSNWVLADADAASTSTGFLGIAVSASTGNDFLIRGVYNILGNVLDGTSPAIGDPVYISTTAGQITVDAPTATGDIVRCCGHIIDTYGSGRSTYYKIYFNPSPDFIEN